MPEIFNILFKSCSINLSTKLCRCGADKRLSQEPNQISFGMDRKVANFF